MNCMSAFYKWISTHIKCFWKLGNNYNCGFEIFQNDSSLIVLCQLNFWMLGLKIFSCVSSTVCFFNVLFRIPTKPVSAAILHRVLLKRRQKKTPKTNHVGQANVSLACETSSWSTLRGWNMVSP